VVIPARSAWRSITLRVGLLLAGSSVATIVNQIENVRALLMIEVAKQIL
jgi:hypothetical protein